MGMNYYLLLASGLLIISWFILPILVKKITNYEGFCIGTIFFILVVGFGITKTPKYKPSLELRPTKIGRSFLFL